MPSFPSKMNRRKEKKDKKCNLYVGSDDNIPTQKTCFFLGVPAEDNERCCFARFLGWEWMSGEPPPKK